VKPALRWIVAAVIGWAVLWPARPRAEFLTQPETVLWAAPPAGRLIVSPVSGYTFGDTVEGALVGVHALFPFDYVVLGIDLRSTFYSAGSMYIVGIELDGRYGPFYGGIGICMDWMPGVDQGQVPGISFQVGLQVPSFWDNIWLDISYRPNLALLQTRQLVFHNLVLGVVFSL
jgi:hypothetical protein